MDDIAPIIARLKSQVSRAEPAILPVLEKRSLLQGALKIVKEGRGKHQRSGELEQLAIDLQTDLLMTAVDAKTIRDAGQH